MPLLLTGALLSLLPFPLQWAAWRIRLPRRQTRAIVLSALAIDACSLLALAWAQGSLAGEPGSPPLSVYLHIALFMFAMLCAYVITYSALEADSPTLVMVRMLYEARPNGLEIQIFLARLGDDVLVLPRIHDLLRDHMVIEENGRFALTAKGRATAGYFNLYARILGIGLGG